MPFRRNTRFALALYLALSPVAPLAAQPATIQSESFVSADAVAAPWVLPTAPVALPEVLPGETHNMTSAARGPLAPQTTVTVNGNIGAGEYGAHVDGQNQQTNGATTAFMTWDATNLYVAYAGANTTEGVVVYLDINPIVPANGGTNVNGNLTGQTYDGTSFSALPFRADFVTYFKNGYREYRTADGSGGWSGATAGFGSYAESDGNTRELAIPWSALGGQPARFTFFAYATSGAGFVYGQVPTGNAGGTIGTSAVYNRYYLVASTSAPSFPFAADSTPGACYASHDNGTTVFNSADAQALRTALAAASPGSTVKVAGYCSGTQTQGGTTQTALITQTITLAGGYTPTDWTTYNPAGNPTTLDALQSGRVIVASVAATLRGFTMTGGYISSTVNANGGGINATGALTLSEMIVSGSTSTGAAGTQNGGGAYIGGPANVTSTTFSNNGAKTSGGGLYANNTLTLSDTHFISNTATGSGRRPCSRRGDADRWVVPEQSGRLWRRAGGGLDAGAERHAVRRQHSDVSWRRRPCSRRGDADRRGVPEQHVWQPGRRSACKQHARHDQHATDQQYGYQLRRRSQRGRRSNVDWRIVPIQQRGIRRWRVVCE